MRHFFWGLLLPIVAFSLPSGNAVKGGVATLTQEKNALHITSQSERTAIEWDKFSILESESVHFHQPSNNSAILNNVTGGDISHLMGSLESKLGKVYIINPNGIIIGKDAIINVGSLVASTLKITNEDFFKGSDRFFGSERSRVVNLGQINAHSGDINVISYQIDNKGKISAPKGSVTLSAASEAWLQPNGNKKVVIKTTLEAADSEEDGLTNSGVIHALQTELDADGNVYKFAINHSGSIEAPALEEQNGRVFLRAEKGCAKVTGSIEAPGGYVEVLADRVGIDEEAFIDVSHEKQAGAILIGGDWRGENTPFRASHSYLGPEAALHANGLGHGNGGKVILWGDLSSRIFGEASARGGALGGDGGKIEISKVPLLGSNRIYTDAPMGTRGLVLLDPRNVKITGVEDGDVTLGDPTTYSGIQDPVLISASVLGTVLNTSNVEIDASQLNGGTSDGNITISDPLSWSGGTTLELKAGNSGSIFIDADISTSDPGAILSVAGPVVISHAEATTRTIYIPEIISTNDSKLSIENSGTGAIAIENPSGNTLILGREANPLGNITVAATNGGEARISNHTVIIYSSGNLSVSAGEDNDIAYVRSTSASSTGSIRVGGAVSVSNAGSNIDVYISTPELLSTGASTLSIENSGTGRAYINSPTSSLVLGTADNPLGTITVAETGGGEAFITDSNVTIYSQTDLNVSANSNGGRAYVASTNELSTGSITVRGAVSVSNAGSSAYVYIQAPELLSPESTADPTVSIESTGTGPAYIRADAIGTDSERMGAITMTTSSTGQAYIESNYSNDLAIYGTRPDLSSESVPASGVGVKEAPSSSTPLSTGLGYTPADGDVYIQASGTLTLDLDAPTFTANSGNVYFVGENITFGQVNGGGTADDPMWALNSANNLVFEITDENGILQFNEGLTNAGAGTLTLKGGLIHVGTSTHAHTNEILVKPKGALTVDFIHDDGRLGIYGSSGSSKEVRLTSAAIGSEDTPSIKIQEATGKSGAQVRVEGDTDEGPAYLGEYASSTNALNIDITLNAGENVSSSHKSIYVLNKRSRIAADTGITIDVPGDVYVDQANLTTNGSSDSLMNISAKNISILSSEATYEALIENVNGPMELSATGSIEVSTSGSRRAYIRCADNLAITRADGGVSITSSGSEEAFIGVSSGSSGNLDIGWTSKNEIGPIAITASGSGNAYLSAGRDQVQINGGGNITLLSSGTGNAYIEATGNDGSDKNITIGSEADGRSRSGAIMIRSTAGTGNAYFNAPNGSIDITSGAITLSNEAFDIETKTYMTASGDVNIDSSGLIKLHNKGAITSGGSTQDVVWIHGDNCTISDCSGLTLLYDTDGAGDASTYGDIEIVGSSSLNITSSGPVTLEFAADSAATVIYIDLASSAGSTSVTAASIDMVGYNGNSCAILGDSVDINTDTGSINIERQGVAIGGIRSSGISSANGPIDIRCGNLQLVNGGNGTTGSGSVPSDTVAIGAATNLNIAASGAIVVSNSGTTTGTTAHPYVALLSAGDNLTVSDCSNLGLQYTSETATGPGGVGMVAGQVLDVTSRAFVYLQDETGVADESSAIKMLGASVNIESYGLLLLTYLGNSASIESTGGDIAIDAQSGDIYLFASHSEGEAFIAPINSGNITISQSSNLILQSNTSESAYLSAPGTLAITTSGGAGFINSKLFAGGAGGLSLTSGGTITSVNGNIEATNGNVTLVSDADVYFVENDQVAAGGGSIIIACDQASVAPGIGHVNISPSTTFTTDAQLRFFCGYFENNNISTSADLNGGTFSGVVDTPDANNIYGIIYDPNNIPSAYGAPYTFYYEAFTPTDIIVGEVGNGNLLLTSTLVGSSQMSQDAALTQLARFRARFVERGRPFREGLSPWEKRRKKRSPRKDS